MILALENSGNGEDNLFNLAKDGLDLALGSVRAATENGIGYYECATSFYTCSAIQIVGGQSDTAFVI